MNTLALTVGGALLAAVPLLAQIPVSHPVAKSIVNAKLIYDDFRQRLICVHTDGTLQEHDGTSWTVVTARAPANARVAYDEVRGKAYFSYLELFEYDGHATRVLGPSSILQTMVVDSSRNRVVGLRAAPNVSPPVLEIVEFANGAWTVAGAFPGSRGGLASAFDRVRGVVVFQTWLPNSTAGFETWEWDGANLVGPFTDGVSRGAIAFDTARAQVIGIGNSPTSQQTYAWNGSVWSVLPNSAVAEGASSLATDTRNGRIHLLSPSLEGRRSLLTWNGTSWQASIAGPMPLTTEHLAWDGLRGRAVTFGHAGALSEPREHAEFDGFAWHHMPVPATAPPTFWGASYEFDAARGETVVFGGLLPNGQRSGATYAWNGTNWRLAASTGPSPRAAARATYDAARQVLVLVGGSTGGVYLQDHWEWNGSAWTQVLATTPMALGPMLVGYDPVRQRVVAHDQAGSTWEYAGAAWVLVATNGPALYTGAPQASNLVWESSLQGLIAVVSNNGQVAVMSWDGVAWSPRTYVIGQYAHDAARGATYVHGGAGTHLVPRLVASAQTYGSRCGGTGTDTSLTAFGRPRFGNANLHLDLRADARLRPALLGFGLAAGSTPIGNGCEFLLQNPIATRVWFTDAFGFWHQNLPLPNVPALRGLDLYVQGAVLDPASAGGLAMTQGLRLTIGD